MNEKETAVFPRLKGRGRIEATTLIEGVKGNFEFPRLKGRGRIEARQTMKRPYSG